jgi:VWFA-related protein
MPQYKIGVNLVLVDALVRNQSGRVISGLKQDDFLLLEDGKPMQIRYLSESELPLSIALVVDTSGSMKDIFERLRGSAIAAMSSLKREDRVVVFGFAQRTRRLTELTADRQQIVDALNELDSRGGTDILDALFEASSYLKTTAPHDRRAIVLVSDNIAPKAAAHHSDEVIDTAIEFETDVHSIQARGKLAKGLRWGPGLLGSAGLVSVSKIAEATGGEIVRCGVNEVGDTLQQTFEKLRKRYTLGYHAAMRFTPGSFHKIELQLTSKHGKARQDYYVYARRGYYTPQE